MTMHKGMQMYQDDEVSMFDIVEDGVKFLILVVLLGIISILLLCL